MSSPAPTSAADRRPDHPSRLLLLAGLGLAPAAWALHLAAAAALVPLACETGTELWLHLTTLVALPLAVVGLVLAGRLHRALPSGGPNAALGASAVALAALSLGLVVIEGLVVLPLEPC